MAKKIPIGGLFLLSKRTPSIDAKYGPYLSLEDAYEMLGPDNMDVLCYNLTVAILQDDGNIKEYIITKIPYKDDITIENFKEKLTEQTINKGQWINDSLFPYRVGDVVYNFGCMWLCKINNTKQEPYWNSNDWLYLMGNHSFTLSMRSENGIFFRKGNVNTSMIVKIYFGSFDVTERILQDGGANIKWTRSTSDEFSDKSWLPTYINNNPLEIMITNIDVGEDFFNMKKPIFTLTITIPTSHGFETIQQVITIN